MGQQIFPDLKRNEEQLRLIYDKCSDVFFRQFTIQGTIPMLLIYIEGLSDKTTIEKQVIAPLMREKNNPSLQLQQLVEQTIDVSQVEECCDFPRVTELLSAGCVVLLRDSESVGVSFGLNKWEMRGIEEPTAESVVRGSREGFTETLKTNIAQIRRIIKNPQLKVEALKLGSLTQTNVAVVYLDNIADKELVEEVRIRLLSFGYRPICQVVRIPYYYAPSRSIDSHIKHMGYPRCNSIRQSTEGCIAFRSVFDLFLASFIAVNHMDAKAQT